MPHVGDLLAGRYRIDAPLGAGGNAVVYRGHDLRLRRDVALKVLLPHLASDPAVAHRFEREARALAAVNHPGIVAVFDVEPGDPRNDREPFFVMELCERGSLGALIASSGGRLTPDVLTPLLVDVAGGLASLHARGFVHRDVKPHNILLAPAGAKLGDLGVARGTGAAAAPEDGAPAHPASARPFLAPELAAGGPATPASDVYALGAVVSLALTGRAPAGDGSRVAPPSIERPELGTFFDALVAAAMDADPAKRPSPIQFAGQLKAATADWRHARRSPRSPGGRELRESDLAGIAFAPWSVAAEPATESELAAAASTQPVVGAAPHLAPPPRQVRLAPPDRSVPPGGIGGPGTRPGAAGVRPARRPPPPEWLPQRRRRTPVLPLVAGAAILGLALVGAFALTDGFRTLAGGAVPSASRPPTPEPSVATPLPATPTAPATSAPTQPSPRTTPATPAPSAPTASAPTASAPTASAPIDVAIARDELLNTLMAITLAEDQGDINSDDANELRLRVGAIDQRLDAGAWEEAGLLANGLFDAINRLEEVGRLRNADNVREPVELLLETLRPNG